MRPEFIAQPYRPLVERLEMVAPLPAADRQVAELYLSGRIGSQKARGELMGQGMACDRMFLILDGWACQTRTLVDGRRQITSIMLPGDFCDLPALLSAETFDGMHAISAVTYLELSWEKVRTAIERSARIGQMLAEEALAQAAIQREWIVNLGQRSGTERVAHLICELHMRLSLIGRATPTAMEMLLTQVELSDATGLTSVHFNRVLQTLRGARLIKSLRHSIVLPDLAKLRALAGFSSDYLRLPFRWRGPVRSSGNGTSPAAGSAPC